MATELRFDGQAAIVTGGGKGLGRSYALALAGRGAAVLVNDVDAAAADAVVAEINEVGGRAAASHESVATREGGAAIVQSTLDAFGTVDVLVNNAGAWTFGYFADLTPEQIHLTIDTHLLGAFWVSQPAWRVMQERGYGRIVMTSSSSGMFSHAGLANYAAAKTGLYGLTKALSFEGAAYGITCNALLPSAATSPRDAIPDADLHIGNVAGHLHGRVQPELVVPLLLYLVSRECTISGEAFSAVAARYGRVFVGLADGWLAADPAEATPEAIRERMEQIRDLGRFSVPAGTREQLEDLGRAFDALGVS